MWNWEDWTWRKRGAKKQTSELETVNKQEPAKNSWSAKNVVKVVGATWSEGLEGSERLFS